MSSGGAQRLCILRRYPYPVYGTAGPVGGGPRGDYRRSEDPILVWKNSVGKGLTVDV